MKDARRIVLSAPYPEAAARAIASRLASIHGSKVLRTGGLPNTLVSQGRRLRLLTADQVARLSRRSEFGADSESLASRLEVVRIAVGLTRSRSLQRSWMYRAAASFDKAVARHPSVRAAELMIGMPGACLESFGAVAANGGGRVFHSVNAHPRVHNARLRDVYGAVASGEAIPERTARRVEAELELATRVLVPSDTVRRQMLGHGVPEHKLCTVPYGVDLELTAPDLAAGTAVPGSRPVQVLFVGQIGYRKGVPFLLHAARGLDIRVLLVGPIVSRGALGRLPSNVEFLGPCSASQVRALMVDSDAFVLPTVEDACALVIAEAVASGLPVITTQENGAAELFGPEDVAAIPSADVRSLRDALSAVRPLAPEERIERSRRIRQLPSLQSWSAYGASVLDCV